MGGDYEPMDDTGSSTDDESSTTLGLNTNPKYPSEHNSEDVLTSDPESGEIIGGHYEPMDDSSDSDSSESSNVKKKNNSRFYPWQVQCEPKETGIFFN